MKKVYKKKPEYLDVVEVYDDSTSIKEIHEMYGIESSSITFDNEGNRVVVVEDVNIPVGSVLFKDKKGSVIVVNRDKILQLYDVYEGERVG
jgi:hypothetical protein